METGRHICNELKALRRRIADENNIPLETEECTYHGECCGTCPRCDAEVRYLEDALSRRLRMGKAAMVAGVALGLAFSTGVKAQNVTDTIPLKPLATEIPDTVGKVRVTGVVLCNRSKMPEPFETVTLYNRGEIFANSFTNMQGEFVLEIPRGEYELVVHAIGFKRYEKKINITNDLDMGVVWLERSTSTISRGLIASPFYRLKIEPLADPLDAEYNANGVKVIVK